MDRKQTKYQLVTSLNCFPSQAAGGGGSKEGRAGADPPAAAEAAVSDRGWETGARGPAADQRQRPASSHDAAGSTGEGAKRSAGAVRGQEAHVEVHENINLIYESSDGVENVSWH